jgi:hypothetical protein
LAGQPIDGSEISDPITSAVQEGADAVVDSFEDLQPTGNGPVSETYETGEINEILNSGMSLQEKQAALREMATSLTESGQWNSQNDQFRNDLLTAIEEIMFQDDYIPPEAMSPAERETFEMLESIQNILDERLGPRWEGPDIQFNGEDQFSTGTLGTGLFRDFGEGRRVTLHGLEAVTTMGQFEDMINIAIRSTADQISMAGERFNSATPRIQVEYDANSRNQPISQTIARNNAENDYNIRQLIAIMTENNRLVRRQLDALENL